MAITNGFAQIELLIKQGYKTDPWFKDQKHLRSLKLQADGYWYRGKALVVPNCKNVRQYILYEIHNSRYAGHLGLNKTRSAMVARYWWPTWGKDMEDYVKRCDTCARNKPSSKAPGGLLQPLPIPDEPWDAVSMDFITQLPETRRGHDAILVFVDRLTKMVHFAPTTTAVDAEETARLFFEHVFRLHGMPKRVLSDRDSRFTSRFWKALMEHSGTKIDLSSAFHPQTDGQTERVNRTLEQMLRMFINPTQDNWDELLPAAEFACNNAVHDSTGHTPFVLNYGRHPATPLDVRIRRDQVPSVQDFVGIRQAALQEAKKCLLKAQQRQKSYADTKRREVTFEIGDQVLLSTKNIKLNAPGTRKLLPRFIGPFEVLQRVGEVAYKLNLPAEMRLHNVFHVSLLAKYDADGTYQPPPPILVNGELEYEIERVLDHRSRKTGQSTKHEFLISWTGYGPEHNLWLPESDVPELVRQEYWAEQVERTTRRAARGVERADRAR
jgi:hypothetical protein